jgi:hypothetical protein
VAVLQAIRICKILNIDHIEIVAGSQYEDNGIKYQEYRAF